MSVAFPALKHARAVVAESDKPVTEYEKPMDVAKARVQAERAKQELAALTKIVTERLAVLGDEVQRLIVEEEALAENFRCDGATVFIRTDTRASAKNHDELAVKLTELAERIEADDPNRAAEFRNLLPSSVNASKLASWVREHVYPDTVGPDGEPIVMTLEERLLHPEPKPFPEELLPLVKLTQQTSVVINGA